MLRKFMLVALLVGITVAAKDMLRKSIVFDKDRPDVFYCPVKKPTDFENFIVQARPLSELCEYEGQQFPSGHKSDCYQDVDETPYACKEKYRIMMRMHPPGSDEPYDGERLEGFMDVDREYVVQYNDKHKIQLIDRLG